MAATLPRTTTYTPQTSRRVAKRLAFAIDDLSPTTSGTVVLGYHRVGGRTASPVDLETSMFRRQIAHLCASGSVLSLDDALAGLIDSDAGPESSIVLTFDDGTADFVDEVLPLLVEFGLPATLYVATGHVDRGEAFPGGAKPVTWEGLREAQSTGLVTIAAHTHNHLLLDRCSVAEAADELDRSNDRIADEVGVDPTHFAYPKAVLARAEVERLVIERYQSAAIAGTKPNRRSSFNAHRLHRSPIQVEDGWAGFLRKVEGGMKFEDDVRRFLNRIRYRGSAS